MIVLGNCKRLFGVDAKMIGWGKCYVETEDWTTARECNKDIVCGEGAFVRKELARVTDVEVDGLIGIQKE